LTHLSLFSGIGGLDIAAEWAGFETVGQCENAEYPTKILEKHWPDVPKWSDICDVTKESFRERTGLSTVDVISGGFPCQPFSVAGKQKGKGDDRYLWPEMLRVIRELAPRWVVGENVPGVIRLAGDTICKDLEREGYSVGIFNFEAVSVGAPHRRARIFFVADTGQQPKGVESAGIGCKYQECKTEDIGAKTRNRFTNSSKNIADTNNTRDRTSKHGTDTERTQEIEGWKKQSQSESGRYSPVISDTDKQGLQRCAETGNIAAYRKNAEEQPSRFYSNVADTNSAGLHVSGHEPDVKAFSAKDGIELRSWWTVEPDMGRVAYGVPRRVDRLKCLGNAVVPQQAYPIFKAISDVERGLKNE